MRTCSAQKFALKIYLVKNFVSFVVKNNQYSIGTGFSLLNK